MDVKWIRKWLSNCTSSYLRAVLVCNNNKFVNFVDKSGVKTEAQIERDANKLALTNNPKLVWGTGADRSNWQSIYTISLLRKPKSSNTRTSDIVNAFMTPLFVIA